MGGCLNAYAGMLISAPVIFRSRAIFAARIRSMTTPALLGLSSTSSLTLMFMGRSPNFRAFRLT